MKMYNNFEFIRHLKHYRGRTDVLLDVPRVKLMVSFRWHDPRVLTPGTMPQRVYDSVASWFTKGSWEGFLSVSEGWNGKSYYWHGYNDFHWHDFTLPVYERERIILKNCFAFECEFNVWEVA